MWFLRPSGWNFEIMSLNGLWIWSYAFQFHLLFLFIYPFFFYRNILYILFGRFFFLNKLFLSQYQIVGSQLDIYIYMAAIWWSTLSLCHFRLNFQQISTEIKRKNCIFNMHCRLNSTLRIYIPRYKIKINFITHECQLLELSAGNAVFAV